MSVRPTTTEPTPVPIEDQILEAILTATLPAPSASSASLSSNPQSEIPNPQSLAHRLHLPLSKVLDILASPLTRSRIAAAQELRDLAFHQREQLAREKALAALESILGTTEDPVEKRRAATAILRRNSIRNPFWPRTPGAGAAIDNDLDEDTDEDATPPRTPLPPPEFPHWCSPARPNLIRLLTRLLDNHNPTPNSGLSTLFYHKSGPSDLEALNKYLKDPGEDAELANFSCAILHTPDPTTPNSGPHPNRNPNRNLPSDSDVHLERVTLHWPTHHRTVLFHFKFAGNSNAELWKIAKLDIGPKDTTNPDSS